MTVSIEHRNEMGQGPLALLPTQQLANRAETSDESSSASISANDFLTLLVTEMKNQDPTANTDPNEYINQLVNVNSLEQLISINQELSGASASPNSQAGATAKDSLQGAPSPALTAPGSAFPTASPAPGRTLLVQGNLGTPPPSSAADRIAQALSSRDPGH